MARFIPKQFAENSTTSVVFGSHQEQGGNPGDGTISSDPATLQGGAAWPLGWSAATDDFFQIPRGEEMEGLERVLSAAIIQQFKDGLTFWQSEMPVTQYQTIVQYQTGSDLPKLYINITGTSTSTPPDSDTTNWFMFFDTAQVSANVSLTNSPYTTNRILEIPQDIKLELNNGTLTLKAGSKVYVPNGFESDGTTPKFDSFTLLSDAGSGDISGISTDYLFFVNSVGDLSGASKAGCYSGTVEPTGTNGVFWYDTTNNVVKRHNGTSWVSGYSLPFCVISSGASSIDQTFNGFGYIGSTVFALPGVKVQIPNGRNVDGTCRSIIATVDSVKTETRTDSLTTSKHWYLLNNLNLFSSSVVSFDADKNIYVGPSGVVITVEIAYSYLTSGKVTSFEPKTVDSVLNSNLSNLSATGEAHFANPDLSNLTATGLTKIFKTGMIIPWGGTSSNKPEGWLVCDGSAVSRTTYAGLFAIIGTAYGAGDGSTTFNLPNYTSKWAGGNGNGYLSAGLPDITGTITQGLYSGGSSIGTGAFKSTLNPTAYAGHTSGSAYYGGFDFSASQSNTVYGAAATVQPPTCKSYWLIKY